MLKGIFSGVSHAVLDTLLDTNRPVMYTVVCLSVSRACLQAGRIVRGT